MDKITLQAPKGANTRKRIVGRGIGSRRGSTSGRGSKGQGSRSGGSVRPGFEGGQMPLYRRIARRGFSNYPFKKAFEVINIEELNVFKENSTVTKDDMVKQGIIKYPDLPIKVLGQGEFTKKITLQIDRVSKTARAKIEKAGGSVVETFKRKEKSEKSENEKE